MHRFGPAFSVLGLPLLAIGGLLLSLSHPQAGLRVPAASAAGLYLLSPDPRLDKVMTVYLRQEARNVSSRRRHGPPAGLAQSIDAYNIVARECTPDVFKATHLPPLIPS